MTALDSETPAAGEHIHLPGPSLQPVLMALGITLALVGVTLGMFLLVAGLLLTLGVTVRWIADTRREIRALPEDLGRPLAGRSAAAAPCVMEREGANLSSRRRAGSSQSGCCAVTASMETPTQRPATVRHRTSLFCDAVAIVEAEYGSDLSLDEIARRVASSRRQLQRSYAEIGETTFREHLTSVRMERAAELLTTRGLTVREVAQRVGYRQPAQFAKAFRRHHGLAPSAFRDTRRFRAATALAA